MDAMIQNNDDSNSNDIIDTSNLLDSHLPIPITRIPDLPESQRSSKEACLAHYTKLQETIQTQIQNYAILPTIPPQLLDPLTANYCEDADDQVLDMFARPIFEYLDQHFRQLDTAGGSTNTSTNTNTNTNVVQTPWRTLLLQYMILHQLTPELLAQKTIKKPHRFKKIQRSLQNPILMNQFLDAGEPKNGNYPKAVQTYFSLLNRSNKIKAGSSSNDIFHRLALAVALEFATPIHIFDTKDEIDPISRYLHYEKAYLDGELDPHFPTLSTWDLRMVVNNDASNDEISWCRNMLRNYRPDHILDRNYHWKYCMVVKTEVRYKVPDWKHYPKTYKQLISGGGKCGPRAWFGRFVCKSFGIPTWGVRQPGHAAMSHWMPPIVVENENNNNRNDGWVICLGGPNWKKSYWDKRSGTHFYWETRARRQSPNEFECIKWMSCFARMNGEQCVENKKPIGLKKDLWTQLKWLKMRQISSNIDQRHGVNETKKRTISSYTSSCKDEDQAVVTIIERVSNIDIDQAQSISYLPNGTICIPASCDRSMPKENAIVMKSFHEDGGDQVHLRQNATLEYCLNIPCEVKQRKDSAFKYRLSCRIVTVHADTSPLILKLQNGSSYEIEIPYSAGEWTSTESIEISLEEGKNNILCFSRDDERALGLSIKDFTLIRVD